MHPSHAAESPPQVWVTLTSIPPRLGRLHHTIATLKKQTRPPDRINICLPTFSRRFNQPYHVPSEILDDPAVTIVTCAEDWGPATKLLGSLALHPAPDTVLITVDDDMLYPPDLVAKLLDRHQRFPMAAIGFCGWNMIDMLRNPEMIDFVPCMKYEEYQPGLSHVTPVDILEGYRGILSVAHFWRPEVFAFDQAPSEMFLVDDLWFGAHLARQKIPRLSLTYEERTRLTVVNHHKVWGHNCDGVRSAENSLFGLPDFYGTNRHMLAWLCEQGFFGQQP